MEKKKTLIVNLYGGPGNGKSTGAAYIFSKLKMLGVNAELVTEFAKDKVFEESKGVFQNQAYMFGKQFFKVSRVAGKVDVIVTDSPLLNTCIYNDFTGDVRDKLNELAIAVDASMRSKNYFIVRAKPYNPAGRFQNEAESGVLSDRIVKFLDDRRVEYRKLPGTMESYDAIVEETFAELQGKEAPQKTRAFISGHRDLTLAEFMDHYAPEIDRAVALGHRIVVCDYKGADLMTQEYLLMKRYHNVVVAHMFESPRNLAADFNTVCGFKSDEERDAWCTANTDYDIAWSRKPGSGTERNLIRRREATHVAV